MGAPESGMELPVDQHKTPEGENADDSQCQVDCPTGNDASLPMAVGDQLLHEFTEHDRSEQAHSKRPAPLPIHPENIRRVRGIRHPCPRSPISLRSASASQGWPVGHRVATRPPVTGWGRPGHFMNAGGGLWS